MKEKKILIKNQDPDIKEINIENSNTRKTIIDPATAPIIKRVFDLYLQGLGSMKIANILTEQKRKTPEGK